MPLQDALPTLDDRTYDDLMREVRTRIARYTPEWNPGWTDVNDSDPGVTLTQVFAWLSEMLLYRMNRVPALNYIKFLELIGVELRAAEPARAEVTLPVDPKFASPTVQVRIGTQLSADPGDGGPQLIFETTRAMVAFRARLAAIVRYDPDTGFAPLSNENDQATQAFQPFGARAIDDAFLGLGFEDPANPPAVNPAPLPGETLDLAIVAAGDNQGVSYVTCSGGTGAAQGPATLVWEYNDGTSWRSLTLLRDDTMAFTRSGHVVLKLPALGIPLAAQTTIAPGDTTPRFWLRARVTKSQYEKPPRLLAIRTNTVPVDQAETIQGEVLGGSDGSRNQVFQLANKPVLAGSLELAIQVSDDGPETWSEKPDLFGSGPSDNDFVLNRTTGEILAGDGVHGNVPVAYVGDPGGNVVAAKYRFGGGRRGNVAAGTITTLVTTVDGIDAGKVANLQAAFAGQEEETLDEAKQRAPSTLRSRDRAVTASDFEYLAKQAGNIKRAKALPGFHPEFPTLKLPGVVSVIVVPDSDPATPAPMPSDGTLRNVCTFLDARRLLTTEVLVLKPSYQSILVIADVVVIDTADSTVVHDAIVKTLVDYFHPLRGGEDGMGWPFGGTIYYSRVSQRIGSVPGVGSVERLTIVLDGNEQPPCTDVQIARNGLLSSVDHQVQVQYAATVDS
jgi:predicted phage baseplate assembly protein